MYQVPVEPRYVIILLSPMPSLSRTALRSSTLMLALLNRFMSVQQGITSIGDRPFNPQSIISFFPTWVKETD